jgi:hypothetical protein
MKLEQNEVAVASIRQDVHGGGYKAVIKTQRGDTFKASSTSAPWNALDAANEKWGDAEMARLRGSMTLDDPTTK